MSNYSLTHVVVLIILFVGSACSVMAGKPVLKGSKWTAVQEMFVADAGTMTITYTLEFLSGKEVRVYEESYLPAHPAMYMNPDGTVDRIPASTSERSESGTYSYRRGKLTVTTEDGLQTEYTFLGGNFVREEPWGETLVFSKDKQ